MLWDDLDCIFTLSGYIYADYAKGEIPSIPSSIEELAKTKVYNYLDI